MSEFDHLVLATPSLSETVQTVGHLLGIQPAEGGRHVGRGTRNFLLGLGNGGYLEIIGPDPEQPEAQPPRVFGIEQLTLPRLVTWAVRVTGIDAAIASARARGFDPGDAWEMTRATPAGDMLRWRLTLDPAGGHTGVVPFLIDWGNTRHPSLDLPQATLLSLTAIHPDPATISARLQAISTDIEIRQGMPQALIAAVEGASGPVTLL
jgi:hypothetical protein